MTAIPRVETWSSATDAPPSLMEWVAQTSERWKHCDEIEETTLLRLHLLRELGRQLHREISSCLASAKREDAARYKAWTQRIEALRDTLELKKPLEEIIHRASSTQPEEKGSGRRKSRLMPEALLLKIPREKLDRYDRVWEGALAAEACQQGWRFWALEASVEISNIEEWNHKLAERIWPNGIVLFVESAETERSGGDEASRSRFWNGKWFIILNPRIQNPSELSREGEPASTWKLLYSPRKR